METQFDIEKLIEQGSIKNDLDLARAMIAERKLRLLAKENNDFKVLRKKLRIIIEQTRGNPVLSSVELYLSAYRWKSWLNKLEIRAGFNMTVKTIPKTAPQKWALWAMLSEFFLAI